MTAIISLLFRRSPTAIAGFVRTVVVDAVERQSKRRIAHVGIEVFKYEPSFTDCDAATAVVFPVFVVWIGAASEHFRPSIIRCRFALSRGLSVFLAASAKNIEFVASTADRVSGSQVANHNDARRSASAEALPAGISHLRGEDAQRGQATEFLPCDINEFRHGDLLQRLLCLGAASVSALSRPTFIAQMVL